MLETDNKRGAEDGMFEPATHNFATESNLRAWKRVRADSPSMSSESPVSSGVDQKNNPPCNTLYVGNLPIDTSEDELKSMFSKQRGYKRLCFRTKSNGPMCFVEFEDVSLATNALYELDGLPLHNSVRGGIRLTFSKNPLGVRSGEGLEPSDLTDHNSQSKLSTTGPLFEMPSYDNICATLQEEPSFNPNNNSLDGTQSHLPDGLESRDCRLSLERTVAWGMAKPVTDSQPPNVGLPFASSAAAAPLPSKGASIMSSTQLPIASLSRMAPPTMSSLDSPAYPTKKKMSLNDYVAKKRAHVSGSSVADVGSSPALPPAAPSPSSHEPSPSTIKETTKQGLRRSAVSEAGHTLNRCSHFGCDKAFNRPCDLTKHEKTHSRPWKCPVERCKYHIYGWPTEMEMDRHHNDKHSSAPPLYECHFKPCPYKSKRESNCKQHMEKAHGWAYVRSKNTIEPRNRTAAVLGQIPAPYFNTHPYSHPQSMRTEDSGYQSYTNSISTNIELPPDPFPDTSLDFWTNDAGSFELFPSNTDFTQDYVYSSVMDNSADTHLPSMDALHLAPLNNQKKRSGNSNSKEQHSGYKMDVTGKCSTCSATFDNAQVFYEHLDDCVLRHVQQEGAGYHIVYPYRSSSDDIDQVSHQPIRDNLFDGDFQSLSASENTLQRASSSYLTPPDDDFQSFPANAAPLERELFSHLTPPNDDFQLVSPNANAMKQTQASSTPDIDFQLFPTKDNPKGHFQLPSRDSTDVAGTDENMKKKLLHWNPKRASGVDLKPNSESAIEGMDIGLTLMPPLPRAIELDVSYQPVPTSSDEDWDIRSIASINTFHDSALGSSIASTASDTIVQGLPKAAQDEILLTIYSDDRVRPLLEEIARKIDKTRFIRNLRRLILLFTIDLKNTAIDSREKDVVNILERHASWFASRLFDLSDPDKDKNSKAMATHLDQRIDKRSLLESYLASRPHESSPAEESEESREENLDTDGADYMVDINYSNFPNLEHIKKFILDCPAFRRFLRSTLNFARNEQPQPQTTSTLQGSRDNRSQIEPQPIVQPIVNQSSSKFARQVRIIINVQIFLGILRSSKPRQSEVERTLDAPPLCDTQMADSIISNGTDDTSMETDDTELTDVDSGTDDTDYDSVDLPDDPELSASAEERISNPKGYFEKLESLERHIYDNSGIFVHRTGTSTGTTEDEELLRFPQSSKYHYSQREQFIEVIKSTRSGQLLCLLECSNLFHRATNNLTVLQENGYCGTHFSVLATDDLRTGVLKIVSIQIQDVFDLAKAFRNMLRTFMMLHMNNLNLPTKIDMLISKLDGEEYSVTERCWSLLVSMGIVTSPSELFPSVGFIWHLAAQAIELAILSYAGAHIERFDLNLLEAEVNSFVLPRRFSYHDETLRAISHSLPYFPSLTTEVSRRQLQCMDTFLGRKQPWVFHGQRSVAVPNERLYLSSTIEALTELWGPSWKVAGNSTPEEIKQYDIGNGAIIPWSNNGTGPGPAPSEIFCHWIPLRAWNDQEVENNQASLPRRYFLPTDVLLIGARSDYGLLVNEKCVPSVERISRMKTKLWGQQALRPPNTSRARRYIDAHSVQIQGSAMGFVSGSHQVTYKRRSGHTMKDALVERWRHGLRNPIDLEAYSGVEISLCSRNARRRRLLNILGSDTMVNYLHGVSFNWVSDICEHAYLKALRCPKSFRKFWKTHKPWQANVGDAISKCLDALEETGIDEDSQELSAFWVESFDDDGDSDGEADDDDSDDGTQVQTTIGLPTPPATPEKAKFFEEWVVTLFRSEHTWTGFLQDSEESLTMAVVGMSCLDFHDQDGFGRNCSVSPKAKGYPVLQTSLQINESVLNTCKLKQEKVASGTQTIWNARELKRGTGFCLGNHGSLEVISGSSKLCPVIVEWKGVKSELLKEIKNAAVNEKLLGRSVERHHKEFIRGTWEVKPLPVLVLSRSTKVRFTKEKD